MFSSSPSQFSSSSPQQEHLQHHLPASSSSTSGNTNKDHHTNTKVNTSSLEYLIQSKKLEQHRSFCELRNSEEEIFLKSPPNALKNGFYRLGIELAQGSEGDVFAAVRIHDKDFLKRGGATGATTSAGAASSSAAARSLTKQVALKRVMISTGPKTRKHAWTELLVAEACNLAMWARAPGAANNASKSPQRQQDDQDREQINKRNVDSISESLDNDEDAKNKNSAVQGHGEINRAFENQQEEDQLAFSPSTSPTRTRPASAPSAWESVRPHPYLVQVLDFFPGWDGYDRELFLVMERCDFGLDDLIRGIREARVVYERERNAKNSSSASSTVSSGAMNNTSHHTGSSSGGAVASAAGQHLGPHAQHHSSMKAAKNYNSTNSSSHINTGPPGAAPSQLQPLEAGRCRFSENEIRKVFLQMLEALVFLNNQGIIHRDVKAENILWQSSALHDNSWYTSAGFSSSSSPNLNSNYKLCDFGVAVKIDNAKPGLTETCFTAANSPMLNMNLNATSPPLGAASPANPGGAAGGHHGSRHYAAGTSSRPSTSSGTSKSRNRCGSASPNARSVKMRNMLLRSATGGSNLSSAHDDNDSTSHLPNSPEHTASGSSKSNPRLQVPQKAKVNCGTLWTMSPELLRGKLHDASTDIWSLGVVLYEMCYLDKPYNSMELLAFQNDLSLLELHPVLQLNVNTTSGTSQNYNAAMMMNNTPGGKNNKSPGGLSAHSNCSSPVLFSSPNSLLMTGAGSSPLMGAAYLGASASTSSTATSSRIANKLKANAQQQKPQSLKSTWLKWIYSKDLKRLLISMLHSDRHSRPTPTDYKVNPNTSSGVDVDPEIAATSEEAEAMSPSTVLSKNISNMIPTTSIYELVTKPIVEKCPTYNSNLIKEKDIGNLFTAELFARYLLENARNLLKKNPTTPLPPLNDLSPLAMAKHVDAVNKRKHQLAVDEKERAKELQERRLLREEVVQKRATLEGKAAGARGQTQVDQRNHLQPRGREVFVEKEQQQEPAGYTNGVDQDRFQHAPPVLELQDEMQSSVSEAANNDDEEDGKVVFSPSDADLKVVVEDGCGAAPAVGDFLMFPEGGGCKNRGKNDKEQRHGGNKELVHRDNDRDNQDINSTYSEHFLVDDDLQVLGCSPIVDDETHSQLLNKHNYAGRNRGGPLGINPSNGAATTAAPAYISLSQQIQEQIPFSTTTKNSNSSTTSSTTASTTTTGGTAYSNNARLVPAGSGSSNSRALSSIVVPQVGAGGLASQSQSRHLLPQGVATSSTSNDIVYVGGNNVYSSLNYSPKNYSYNPAASALSSGGPGPLSGNNPKLCFYPAVSSSSAASSTTATHLSNSFGLQAGSAQHPVLIPSGATSSSNTSTALHQMNTINPVVQLPQLPKPRRVVANPGGGPTSSLLVAPSSSIGDGSGALGSAMSSSSAAEQLQHQQRAVLRGGASSTGTGLGAAGAGSGTNQNNSLMRVNYLNHAYK